MESPAKKARVESDRDGFMALFSHYKMDVLSELKSATYRARRWRQETPQPR